MSNSRSRIVVTEIPYMVNKAKLVEKIAELCHQQAAWRASPTSGTSRDRNGMRIVIELKQDVNPQVVLNYLYKHTQMQETFGAIMLALVDGEPRVLNLRADDLLTTSSIRRTWSPGAPASTWTRPRPARHILEGLLIALDHIDEIVQIIRSSENPNAAKADGLIERFRPLRQAGPGHPGHAPGRASPAWSGRSSWRNTSELEKTIAELTAILADERLLHERHQDGDHRHPGQVCRRAPHGADHHRGRNRRGRPDPGGGHGGHPDPLRAM